MALSLRALVALAILACASAANWRHVQMSASRLRRPATSPPWSQYNQTEHYYTGQRLDHFNTLDHRTWSQRYFVIENFWKAPHGTCASAHARSRRVLTPPRAPRRRPRDPVHLR